MRAFLFLVLMTSILYSCDSTKKVTNSAESPSTAVVTNNADIEEGKLLIEKYMCATCHKVDKFLMGPPYVLIAQKYMPTSQNIRYLMSKISNGSTGVWGKAKMNPHKSINDKDLEKMSRFILSLHNHPQDMLPQSTTNDNTLSGIEKAQGWQLLFDGKTLNGWRNFNKSTIGKSWIINDNSIHLNAQKLPEGQWQAADGGDIITAKTYRNYILKYDWKVNDCGNSGLIFNVVEDKKYDFVWQTGPEMQVLDNACHPDAKIKTHRAADLYDMIEAKPETVLAGGQWNQAMIKNINGQVEFWLNGAKVVEFTMHDEEWKNSIAKSKFKDMPDFGMARSGHISLQDHGDKVWFKNIKIKEVNN